MDPLTALTALGPLVVDLGKGFVNRFVAPRELRPVTVEEYAKMKEVDLAMFKAMNEQSSGTGYQWAETVVKMQRPAVAFCVLTVWAWSAFTGNRSDSIDNFAGAIFFYLFGDRTLTASKRGSK
jgi:hypothetical protein